MPTTRSLSRPTERPSRLPIWCLPLAVLLLLPSPSYVSAQGVLQGLRDDVRQPSPPSTDSDWDDDWDHGHGRKDDHWCDCDDDDDHGLGDLIGWVTVGTVTSPYWAPRGMVGDDSFDPGYFAR